MINWIWTSHLVDANVDIWSLRRSLAKPMSSQGESCASAKRRPAKKGPSLVQMGGPYPTELPWRPSAAPLHESRSVQQKSCTALNSDGFPCRCCELLNFQDWL